MDKIIDSTDLAFQYNGEMRVFDVSAMQEVLFEMEQLRYIFENDKIKTLLSRHSLEAGIEILHEMCRDTSDSISIYLKLLDRNLVSVGFNETGIQIQNSDKLSIFGTVRIDVADVLQRFRNYVSSFIFLHIRNDELKRKFKNDLNNSIFVFENNIGYSELPPAVSKFLPETFETDNEDKQDLDIIFSFSDDNNQLVITTEKEIVGNMIFDSMTGLVERNFVTNSKGELMIECNELIFDKSNGLILLVEGKKISINGFVLITKKLHMNDIENFDFSIFGLTQSYSIWHNSKGENVQKELSKDFFNMFLCDDVFDCVVSYVEKLIVSYFVFLSLQNKVKDSKILLDICKNKFDLKYFDIVYNANKLLKLNLILKTGGSLTTDQLYKQDIVYDDLAQSVSFDDLGNPIYDVNEDGFIDGSDLDILHSVVKNPENFDFEIVNNIWHKRFRPENMTEDQISNFMKCLKVLLYVLEKNNFDEIRSYLFLLSHGLVDEGFDLKVGDMNKISTFGFEYSVLDDDFMILRMFFNSLDTILVKDVKYLISLLGDSASAETKSFLKLKKKLEFKKIIYGLFIEAYLNTFKTEDRYDKETEIRNLLAMSLGSCYDYAHKFKVLIKDIKKTPLFKECLVFETEWLDSKFPSMKDKLIEKYK